MAYFQAQQNAPISPADASRAQAVQGLGKGCGCGVGSGPDGLGQISSTGTLVGLVIGLGVIGFLVFGMGGGSKGSSGASAAPRKPIPLHAMRNNGRRSRRRRR
jgi:hypothetical protein